MYFKDSTIKKIFTREKIKELGSYIPDGSFIKNGIIYCFEYENSSRGLMTHVAKYLKCAKYHPNVKFMVILIRSINHKNNHKQDFELAKFLAEYSSKNIKFKFLDCAGDLDLLVKVFNKLKGYKNENT